MLKSFKEFAEIKRTNNIIDDDGHLKDLSDDSVIEKLNAFVGSIGMKEYLVPEKAVDELRQKLMRIGLHFEDVQFTGNEGEVSLPLVMNGGAFGKSVDTPIDEFDDEKESGRSINFVFEKLPSGTHKVMAQIV
tara:strand:- start:2554 stop:2952 length:399 start_codon:yes stop_codon:yes gene_type:complete